MPKLQRICKTVWALLTAGVLFFIYHMLAINETISDDANVKQ